MATSLCTHSSTSIIRHLYLVRFSISRSVAAAEYLPLRSVTYLFTLSTTSCIVCIRLSRSLPLKTSQAGLRIRRQDLHRTPPVSRPSAATLKDRPLTVQKKSRILQLGSRPAAAASICSTQPFPLSRASRLGIRYTIRILSEQSGLVSRWVYNKKLQVLTA